MRVPSKFRIGDKVNTPRGPATVTDYDPRHLKYPGPVNICLVCVTFEDATTQGSRWVGHDEFDQDELSANN